MRARSKTELSQLSSQLAGALEYCRRCVRLSIKPKVLSVSTPDIKWLQSHAAQLFRCLGAFAELTSLARRPIELYSGTDVRAYNFIVYV